MNPETAKDPCEKCDCIEDMVSVRDMTEEDGYRLIPCPCSCHLTDQELYEYDQDDRLHARMEVGK